MNLGQSEGVTTETRFLIYRIGPEIRDPDTSESLGNLEVAIGQGKPKHIQAHLTTVIPAHTRTRIRKLSSWMVSMTGTAEQEIEEPISFDEPCVGDLVRVVS